MQQCWFDCELCPPPIPAPGLSHCALTMWCCWWSVMPLHSGDNLVWHRQLKQHTAPCSEHWRTLHKSSICKRLSSFPVEKFEDHSTGAVDMCIPESVNGVDSVSLFCFDCNFESTIQTTLEVTLSIQLGVSAEGDSAPAWGVVRVERCVQGGEPYQRGTHWNQPIAAQGVCVWLLSGSVEY